MSANVDFQPPPATIIRSEDGGPLRRIINGRAVKPTGVEPCIKAGYRGMPWESEKAELPALMLAEVGSPIIDLLAQPHRLEMSVVGQSRPMAYLADLQLTVEESFARLLTKGAPFGRAIVEWMPDPKQRPRPRTLVVEVKDDADRRKDDPYYMEKLRLARKAYALAGYGFIQIVRSRDIACVDMRIFNDVWLDRRTHVTAIDVGYAVRYLRSHDGVGTRGGLIDALGGGPRAKARASALHVRRIVSIDLRGPLCESTVVRLIRPFQSEASHGD